MSYSTWIFDPDAGFVLQGGTHYGAPEAFDTARRASEGARLVATMEGAEVLALFWDGSSIPIRHHTLHVPFGHHLDFAINMAAQHRPRRIVVLDVSNQQITLRAWQRYVPSVSLFFEGPRLLLRWETEDKMTHIITEDWDQVAK